MYNEFVNFVVGYRYILMGLIYHEHKFQQKALRQRK